GSPASGAGNGISFAPVITPDGRYVAFQSTASNLVPNDANGHNEDVFRWDRLTGSIIVISVATNGTQGNSGSFWPSISDDGNRVAFESAANNLVPGDGNGVNDVFVRDVGAGTTIRVSVTSSGGGASEVSGRPNTRRATPL